MLFFTKIYYSTKTVKLNIFLLSGALRWKANPCGSKETCRLARIRQSLKSWLTERQIDSFNNFLQADTPPHRRKKLGCSKCLKWIFLSRTHAKNSFSKFSNITSRSRKYSVVECQERGLNICWCRWKQNCDYPPRKKAKRFLLILWTGSHLGNLPAMSAPRHVHHMVQNACRESAAPVTGACFFGESFTQNGTMMYSARIIPFRGSWVEFATDINNVMYAYIDRKKTHCFFVINRYSSFGYILSTLIFSIVRLSNEVENIIDLENSFRHEVLGKPEISLPIDVRIHHIIISVANSTHDPRNGIIRAEYIIVPLGERLTKEHARWTGAADSRPRVLHHWWWTCRGASWQEDFPDRLPVQ